ncbi:MAG: prepilin-type N-terminal cleavage/methylation domain-containing protein [Brevinematales bacterium]
MILSKHWISGFTLIEVLVALSLTSIAILAVVGVWGTLSLFSERSSMVDQLAVRINDFLVLSQTSMVWTNWREGTWHTNIDMFPVDMTVIWKNSSLCVVKVQATYLVARRTNHYEVETAFSRAYEEAF